VSGIVVLLHHDGAPVDRALLERMTSAQRFRGPDAERTWLDVTVGLGHTLHKTTLEAENEQQPAALDGRFFITADARIDARDELCDRLRGRGVAARTDATDPELILKAYATWGDACFEHLLGDFSFALWDASQRKLVCAVDHLGVKPFFYANQGGLFAASNSVACLRMHPDVRDDLNEIAVGDYLMFGAFEDRAVTIYRDIARIPPGHYLIVERGVLRLQRYFTLAEPSEVHCASDDARFEEFEELLARAVRDRLRTPRVAILMSGGVDSPLLARVAKRELEHRFARPELQASTVVFDRLIPDDERYYAGLAAESIGIPIQFQSGDDRELYDWAERYVPAQPIDTLVLGDWVEQLTHLTQRSSTILTGFDGDALLGATVRLHWLERARACRLRLLARELGWYVRHVRALPPIGVRTALAPLKPRAKPARTRPAWLRSDFCARTGLDQRWRTSIGSEHQTRSRDSAWCNLRGSLWGALFDSFDPAAVGIAADTRHPLADVRIVRFALGLPAVPWCVDKWLLRRGLRGLPEAIVRRPKTPLRAEPDLVLFRSSGGGTRSIRHRWHAEALESYVDYRAIEHGLDRATTSDAELYELLRAVGFGVWLRGRLGIHSDA
jgi:asparagine synthase (glutamine-hydrolysing)